MAENNSVINALKRLERAGSEESRATEKLKNAAEIVAAMIEQRLEGAEVYPRGSQHLNWDGSDTIPHDRNSSLRLARAIATGWLDELATWLEQRSTESAEATATLERAAETMRC